MNLEAIGNPTYIALQTFRTSGQGVDTPVWVTADAGRLYVLTERRTGKVRRMANDSRVAVCVSDARGLPKGEWIGAEARLVEDPGDVDRVMRRQRDTYGLVFRPSSLVNRRSEGARDTVVLEIGAGPQAADDPAVAGNLARTEPAA